MMSDSDDSVLDFDETGVSENQLYESGESSGNEGDIDNSESEKNFIGLQGYDHEPKRKTNAPPVPHDIEHLEDEVEEEEPTRRDRVGNVDWCLCGQCNIMTTDDESRCCREIPEVLHSKMDGKILNSIFLLLLPGVVLFLKSKMSVHGCLIFELPNKRVDF